MSSLVHTKEGKFRLYVKGASEIVVQACSHHYSFRHKQSEPMSQIDFQEIEKAAETMSALALRVIAVAFTDFESIADANPEVHEPDNNGVHPFEDRNLTFIGLFGITDVLRDGVENAVKQCQKAGIRVRMVTGDSKLTAVAIAKQCGILDPNDNSKARVMEGKEFMELIEGIVCAYCRTKRCNCLLVEENATRPNSPKDSPSKDPLTKVTELVPLKQGKL